MKQFDQPLPLGLFFYACHELCKVAPLEKPGLSSSLQPEEKHAHQSCSGTLLLDTMATHTMNPLLFSKQSKWHTPSSRAFGGTARFGACTALSKPLPALKVPAGMPRLLAVVRTRLCSNPRDTAQPSLRSLYSYFLHTRKLPFLGPASRPKLVSASSEHALDQH